MNASSLHRARDRRGGIADLVLVGVVTIVITTMVGVGVGAGVVGSSAGCNDVLERFNDGEPVDEAEIRRCQDALPNQLAIASAGANFVPTGANDTFVTQVMTKVVDLGSRPPATEDAPLPPEVQFAADGWPGMRHCVIQSHGLYPHATGICYAWSPSEFLDEECSSEGGSAGGGPCPGGTRPSMCLTATSSGFSQWVEYGIEGSEVSDAEAGCARSTQSFVYPYDP